MIGAGCVVARGLRTVLADEDAAGVGHLLEQRLVGDAEMLGREAIGKLERFLERARHDDRAVAGDGLARDTGGRQVFELDLDLRRDGAGQAL